MPDAFDILGLPPRFELPESRLQAAYLARVAGAHPDAAGDSDESLQGAAMVNDARALLADPERRAEELLRRLGGPGKSEDKTLPAGFLGEVMELRERIDDELALGVDGARERWQRFAGEQRAVYVERLTELFSRAPAGSPAAPGLLHDIRTQLNAWRYIERLIEQLDPGYDPSRADFTRP